jgi:hypothetical protein
MENWAGQEKNKKCGGGQTQGMGGGWVYGGGWRTKGTLEFPEQPTLLTNRGKNFFTVRLSGTITM